ncbi:tape measure protein [Paenalcaligenes niemegkensis]|uniref:tape measure protein n=1 Tax=Paenalcaligenes niemegkensis TaxID=2895469 RepID=UPI001EE805DA|nr:tape measure protein [Paenalcaligenes niemegkensis]MCQ9618403.1 tape measure protein [Paenalcaligenes niemegkensis]
MVDQYGQMADRIKMATASMEEYDLVQRRLLASANSTYRPLQEAQELYIRTADSIRALGFDINQVLDITDSFSYLLVTNAASADRASSAINAYSKSIQTGRVASESWQTILAAMPSLSKTLADALGKTTTEIQKLGIEGKLALSDLNRGLLETVELNKALTDGMGTTVVDATIRLKNNITSLLGEKNRANGATASLAAGIDVLSNNLDTLSNVAGGVAVAGVTLYATKTAFATKAAWDGYLASLSKSKAYAQEAIGANNAAQSAKVIAAADLSRARTAVTSAEAQVAADQTAQAANLLRLKNMQQLMVAENALEVQRMKAQISDKGRQMAATRMAEIRLAEVAIAKQVEGAEKTLAATTVATSAVVQKAYADRAAAAGMYATAAKTANATTVAAERATAATNVFARAGAGLLGVLGGPVGLAVTAGIAATTLFAFRDSGDAAKVSTVDLTQSVNELTAAFTASNEAKRTNMLLDLEGELSKAESAADKATKALKQLIDASEEAGDPSDTTGQLSKALDQLRQDIDSISSSSMTAEEKSDALVRTVREMSKVLPKGLADEFNRAAAEAGGSSIKVQELLDWVLALRSAMGTPLQTKDALGEGVVGKLSEEYLKLEGQLNRQIALFGKTGRAAQLRYDIEHGELSKMAPLEKERALASVAELEGLEKAEEARRKAASASGKQAKEIDNLLKSLRDQSSVLGMTEQQAARYRIEMMAGTEVQKKAALAMLDQIQAHEKLTNAGEAYKSLLLDLRTDQQRSVDLFKEQKKALDEAGVSAEEYARVMARMSEVGIGTAPKFGGLDASVGGASGELIRVAEARAELEKWRLEELERQQQYLDQKLINEQQYAENVLNITRQTNEQQANLQASWRSATLANFSSVTGDAAAMLRELGGESSALYKTMFLAGKAASIAQAIVNTEEAATRALTVDPSGILSSVTRGLGYTSVGIMSATALTGMAHNGIDAVPREGTWLLDKGERVLSSRQNADLTSYLKGVSSPAAASSQQITIQVVVNAETGEIDAAGGDDPRWQQIGAMIAASARQVIVEEMRPHGMLDRNI